MFGQLSINIMRLMQLLKYIAYKYYYKNAKKSLVNTKIIQYNNLK